MVGAGDHPDIVLTLLPHTGFSGLCHCVIVEQVVRLPHALTRPGGGANIVTSADGSSIFADIYLSLSEGVHNAKLLVCLI